MTRIQMMNALKELGMRLETVNLGDLGSVARIRDTRSNKCITDHPDLISERYISWTELDTFMVGFFAGRAA